MPSANPAATLPPRGIGYGARCRPCNSPHRAAIDERLLGGESSRMVSAWLAETHGERIPHQALGNHRTEHLDVKAEAEAVIALATAAPAFHAAVQRVVADVGVLDEVASIGLRVARALEPHVSNPALKVTQPIATVFAAALSNARAAVMDRHEMLHGKKLEVTNTGGPEAVSPEALHARLASLAALATEADAAAARAAEPGAAG